MNFLYKHFSVSSRSSPTTTTTTISDTTTTTGFKQLHNGSTLKMLFFLLEKLCRQNE